MVRVAPETTLVVPPPARVPMVFEPSEIFSTALLMMPRCVEVDEDVNGSSAPPALIASQGQARSVDQIEIRLRDRSRVVQLDVDQADRLCRAIYGDCRR